MTTRPTALPAHLVDQASARFRPAGRFAYHYARGKIGGDAAFAALLQQGLLPPRPRWLDLGCGQGSLFALLLAAQEARSEGRWPAGWPVPPQAQQLRGVELMARDVQRAALAFGAEHPLVRIEQGDMNAVDFGRCDVVTIFDALHYFDHTRQRQVFERIHSALAPGGLFITRIGDAGAGLPFALSQWVDRAVTWGRGHRVPPLYCRPLDDWRALLESVGFEVSSQPMSGALPFANVLLVCRVRQAGRIGSKITK